MRVIDLSRTIQPGMTVFPGSPRVEFRQLASIAEHGFAETGFRMVSHTGTHVDAPAHLVPGGLGLPGLAPETWAGPGCVADVRGLERINQEHLEPYIVSGAEWLLLRTGWGDRPFDAGYYYNYPGLESAAAQWLAGLGLKGIGLDTPSPDVIDNLSKYNDVDEVKYELWDESNYNSNDQMQAESNDETLPAHRALFAAGMVVVENLCNLAALPGSGFVFVCAPLPLASADGAPCRCLALVPNPL